MELFPFWNKKDKEQTTPKEEIDRRIAVDDDGSFAIDGNYYGYSVQFDWFGDNQDELIINYRTVALQPEVDYAIEDIVNEAVSSSEEDDVVAIDLQDVESLSEKIKEKVREEFEEVLNLLDFNNNAHNIFRGWYVDGVLYYHKIVNEKRLKDGIIAVQKLDSAKTKAIKEIERNADGTIKQVREYFLYDESRGEQGNKTKQNQGAQKEVLKLPKDAIVRVSSGLVDPRSRFSLSHLHKAIKPANQLRMMEDSSVIYRIARAPERRVFYVDVGSLRGKKAEAYVRNLMASQRSKVTYDIEDGKVSTNKNHMTMLEDIWLPRREGGKGTEVTTLQGGQNLGEMADVEFFLRKLYKSLNVPMSRLESDGAISFGRGSEITRDELKFNKFVARLRKRFNALFLDLLRTQLILKNILTEEDWDAIRNKIKFIYTQDFHLNEIKEFELLQSRAEVAEMMTSYVGKYYSNDYMRRNVFKQTEEEIAEEDKKIKEEKDNPQFAGIDDIGMGGGGFGGGDFGGGNDFGGGDEEKPKEEDPEVEKQEKADDEEKKKDEQPPEKKD